MSVFFCLVASVFNRNNNIAKHFCTCIVIYGEITIFAHWERKNICAFINISVFFIKFVDCFIIDKSYADFSGLIKALIEKYCFTTTANKHSHTRWDFHNILLIINNYSHFLVHFFCLISCFS